VENIKAMDLVQGAEQFDEFIQFLQVVVFVEQPFISFKSPGEVIPEIYRSVVEKKLYTFAEWQK
jgi:hypothetical protein